jgi:hypothetical protein
MDLIDREQLKSTIRKMVEIPNETRAQVIGAINRAKVVDIVRCNDCKYKEIAPWYKGYRCGNPLYGMASVVALKDNDFCSYGERKVEDGN